jgi:hypothetical protein
MYAFALFRHTVNYAQSETTLRRIVRPIFRAGQCLLTCPARTGLAATKISAFRLFNAGRR